MNLIYLFIFLYFPLIAECNDLVSKSNEHWLKGLGLQQAKQYAEAIKEFDLSIQLIPGSEIDQNISIWYDRGMSYKEIHQVDKALADFDFINSRNIPNEMRVKVMMARSDILDHMKEKDFKEYMAKHLQKYQARFPNVVFNKDVSSPDDLFEAGTTVFDSICEK